MNGDRIAAIIGLLGALILAGSAIARQRPRVPELLRLGVVWIVVIAAAWLIVSVIPGLRHT